MQAANNNSPLRLVRAAPETMLQAPIVITDIVQIPTNRGRDRLFNMLR